MYLYLLALHLSLVVVDCERNNNCEHTQSCDPNEEHDKVPVDVLVLETSQELVQDIMCCCCRLPGDILAEVGQTVERNAPVCSTHPSTVRFFLDEPGDYRFPELIHFCWQREVDTGWVTDLCHVIMELRSEHALENVRLG